MEKTRYTPSPADTSGTVIPEELASLTEMIARNAHEVWAAARMAAGWSWGPVRDDEQKRHPCLVPYEELSDGEKEYDRKCPWRQSN